MSHRKPSRVQIRRFDSQDSTAVLQLANELIPKSEGTQRATMLKNVLRDPNYSLYVAEVNECIAGFIDLRVFPDFVEGILLALIQNVVVQKRFRQQGIGSKLLHRVISDALQRNVGEIHVWTEFENQQAITFYIQHGFQKRGIVLEKENK
jgi:ribosomal protein S18 acetylase RimI-like enzyme